MLGDISRLLRRTFDERARNIGVTRPRWQVLMMLHRHEGINQGGLADLLDVEPITLCRMVDRLQEAELVERRRDPADRRAWRLFPTDKAQELLAELNPLGHEVIEIALAGIPQQERDALCSILKQIRQNLSRRTESDGPVNPETEASQNPTSSSEK